MLRVQPFSTNNQNPAFGQRSVVIFTPECLKRKLSGVVRTALRQEGVEVIKEKKLRLPGDFLSEHFANISDKPTFKRVIDFMRSGNSRVLIVQDKNATKPVGELCIQIKNLYNKPGEQIRDLLYASPSKEASDDILRAIQFNLLG